MKWNSKWKIKRELYKGKYCFICQTSLRPWLENKRMQIYLIMKSRYLVMVLRLTLTWISECQKVSNKKTPEKALRWRGPICLTIGHSFWFTQNSQILGRAFPLPSSYFWSFHDFLSCLSIILLKKTFKPSLAWNFAISYNFCPLYISVLSTLTCPDRRKLSSLRPKLGISIHYRALNVPFIM